MKITSYIKTPSLALIPVGAGFIAYGASLVNKMQASFEMADAAGLAVVTAIGVGLVTFGMIRLKSAVGSARSLG
ncbi:hypothetical protein [Rhizobium leguminosarum]|uniref:hypothetical protein n=1 Tax=Rhizobium leguminosarum TaxID=384 RepID=UPI002E0D7F18|nr:hypothetical protein U8Q02_40545 [Rhizobium leguminosarum]